jgi:Na+/H+-dicarboxylate symporter
MLPLLVLAVISGAALRRETALQKKQGQDAGAQSVSRIVSTLLGATRVAIGWVVAWVPLAVYGVLAKTVGELGFEPLKRLPIYIGVALLGLALQVFVVYSIY